MAHVKVLDDCNFEFITVTEDVACDNDSVFEGASDVKIKEYMPESLQSALPVLNFSFECSFLHPY